MIEWIIILAAVFIAGFLIGKYIAERIRWADKKREIERQYEERISEQKPRKPSCFF
ncbi:MAG: hypothetical protein NTV63_00835 [Candidatus Woesearchaeota archaeon]|nr:hypothetical protein [Candidatus Woesearchaeota archaeon]